MMCCLFHLLQHIDCELGLCVESHCQNVKSLPPQALREQEDVMFRHACFPQPSRVLSLPHLVALWFVMGNHIPVGEITQLGLLRSKHTWLAWSSLHLNPSRKPRKNVEWL